MSTWNIEKSILSFTCDKVLTPDFKLLLESVTGNTKTMKCLGIDPGAILEPLLPGDFHKQQEKNARVAVMCQVRVQALLSIHSRSPEMSSYFIQRRKFKPRDTIGLPKVTQGESSKVWDTGKSPRYSPLLLLPADLGRLPHGPGFPVT